MFAGYLRINMKLFAVVVLLAISAAFADHCFYALDNVDTSFVKFQLEQGNVTLLGQLPENPTLRVSAVYNSNYNVYHIVSQPSNETVAGPKTLFTVDLNTGNVVSSEQFGNEKDFPANLVWSAATKTVCSFASVHLTSFLSSCTALCDLHH
mgnify:CR=1 FL=1